VDSYLYRRRCKLLVIPVLEYMEKVLRTMPYYQQDNALVHKAKIVQTFFYRGGPEVVRERMIAVLPGVWDSLRPEAFEPLCLTGLLLSLVPRARTLATNFHYSTILYLIKISFNS